MITKALIISTVSAIAFVGAANAAPGGQSVQFSYDTLELSNSASVSALYSRMEASAEEACADRNNPDPIRIKTLIERCESDLVSSWVAAIGDDRLNQRHAQAQSGRAYASVE